MKSVARKQVKRLVASSAKKLIESPAKKRKKAAKKVLPPVPAGPPLPLTPSYLHSDEKTRCWQPAKAATSATGYCASEPLMLTYHDECWGRAVWAGGDEDDRAGEEALMDAGRALYKQLILQTMQSGLSWKTVLQKQEAIGKRFEGFDYHKVALWEEGGAEFQAAMNDASIIRNRLKIKAAMTNARVAAMLDAETKAGEGGAGGGSGGFVRFLYGLLGKLPEAERLLQHSSPDHSHMRSSKDLSAKTADGVHPTVGLVRAVAVLKQKGFTFIGPVTLLSFVQAAGLVNHHKPDCWCFDACERQFRAAKLALLSGRGGEKRGRH